MKPNKGQQHDGIKIFTRGSSQINSICHHLAMPFSGGPYIFSSKTVLFYVFQWRTSCPCCLLV